MRFEGTRASGNPECEPSDRSVLSQSSRENSRERTRGKNGWESLRQSRRPKAAGAGGGMGEREREREGEGGKRRATHAIEGSGSVILRRRPARGVKREDEERGGGCTHTIAGDGPPRC